MKIVLIHYRYAPAIGGVELVMEQHARFLADAGHEVTVLTGSGSGSDARVRVVILPELLDRSPSAVAAAEAAFAPWLEWADRVVAHNVLTMPFAPACTAALWRLAERFPAGRVINWVHDLAALNPDYAVSGDDLLRQRSPAMRVVAISEWRARQFAQLTGTPLDEIAVVPNGIDPVGFLNLTPRVARFARERRLLEAEVILLQPARILRRKNIELGLRLVAELKSRGCRATLLVTGAPDPHNASSARYRQELLTLREALGVEEEALFVSDFFPVAKADLASLYALSDVLWLPSRDEGFGLPMLEGALHRILLFCADRSPMNTLGLPGAEFFDPDSEPGEIADRLLRGKNKLFLEARRAVIERFAWEAVWPQIAAVLELT
jgi:glycosyltransferase involved in cell wall biosynthesis